MKTTLRLLFTGTLALSVASCGWLDDDDDPNLPESERPRTSIVSVAAANGNFTTLVAALEATDLDDTLANPDGTFTVFAPTDEAFEALGEDTIAQLLDDPDTLAAILTYHVLDSEVDASAAIAAAEDGEVLATVNGANIGLSLSGESLLVNTSTVVTPDVETDNGVIHVIDAVLMPPMPVDASSQTIAEVAVANPDLSTLVTALQTADLVDTLSNPDATFTVFAPTNAAFAMIDEALLAAILDDSDALNAILLQHVFPGAAVDAVTAFSLNGTSIEMVSGTSIPVAINPETDQLTVGGANVVITDIQTANGIVHVIDMVIVGDVVLPQPTTNSIVDVAASLPDFSTLVSLVQQAGLADVLSNLDAEFTVFAPTNAAFAQLPQSTLDALANDVDALANVLTYHVISGSTILQDAAVSVAQSDSSLVTMENGEDVALSLSGDTLYVNLSAVSQANVMADNGVIHVVDQVILPPTPTSVDGTVVDAAIATPEFSTLVELLTAADLVDTLSNPDAQLTVFAPTNAAFDKIADDALAAVGADNALLTGVLTQHVVAGAAINSVNAFAANGASVNTVAENDVDIRIVNYANAVDDDNAEVTYNAESGLLVGGSGSSQPGFTLYVFNNDLGNAGSVCNDGCATNWPPVLVTDGMPSGVPGLGTVTRDDDTVQVTFQGRPLYFFINDAAAGDENGEAVNDVWFVQRLPQTALMVQGARVTTTDITTSNGIIHVIDSVILETLE